MRTLRVVITVVGGAPLITATLAPSGCGGTCDVSTDATVTDTGNDRSMDDASFILPDGETDTGIDTGIGPMCNLETVLVTLPQPGVPADPGQLCAVSPPAKSNTSARVMFTQYNSNTGTAIGFIAVQPTVAGSIVGLPTLTVTSASDPKFAMLQASGMTKTAGGYVFTAKWPALSNSMFGGSLNVKTTFTVNCGDGGTEVVESITPVAFCWDGEKFEWVSAGDACQVCAIIAEMAPSPIVSDVIGDNLPLARVIQIVVREIARVGRSVLLMAENDAGEDAEYEWRVSKGGIETVAPDIVLWTLPEGVDRPFGQVAVLNATGAVVENFVWGGV